MNVYLDKFVHHAYRRPRQFQFAYLTWEQYADILPPHSLTGTALCAKSATDEAEVRYERLVLTSTYQHSRRLSHPWSFDLELKGSDRFDIAESLCVAGIMLVVFH